VRWENKISFDCLLSHNICAENYQNRFTYVGVIDDDYDDDDDHGGSGEFISRRDLVTAYLAWTIKGKAKGCRTVLYERMRDALLPS